MKKFGMFVLFGVFAFSSAAVAKSETKKVKKANTLTVVKKEEAKTEVVYDKVEVSSNVQSLKFRIVNHPRDWTKNNCLKIIEIDRSQLLCYSDGHAEVDRMVYGKLIGKVPFVDKIKTKIGKNTITLKVSITKWEVYWVLDSATDQTPSMLKVVLKGHTELVVDKQNVRVDVFMYYPYDQKRFFRFSKSESVVTVSDSGPMPIK